MSARFIFFFLPSTARKRADFLSAPPSLADKTPVSNTTQLLLTAVSNTLL